MSKELYTLREGTTNVEMFNAIRHNASTAYQSRVPAATKANVQAIGKLLTKYAPLRNEAIDSLVNQIGLYLFRTDNWTNPLAKFKIGMYTGDTIQETKLGLVKAKSFDPRRDVLERDLFGQKAVESQSSWHRINRQDRYDITIQDSILRRALLDPEGLAQFVSDLMAVPGESDQVDEFLLMTSLFKEYDDSDGFFHVNVPDVSSAGSTEADSKYALRRVRELAMTLPFKSRHYNAAGMPVSAKPEDLELFGTPEFFAATDVEALAGAFNVDKASMPAHQTVIPRENFRVPGCQAILTTKDFFVVADTLMESRQMQNPGGLYDNYFLHHHQIISASRFVPAVMFHTGAGDTITISDPAVASVEAILVYDGNGEPVDVADGLRRGGIYQVRSSAITAPAGGENDAVRWTLAGSNSERTVLTQEGVLFISPDETSSSLIVKATATDDNAKSVNKGFEVTGDILRLWPNPAVVPEAGGEVDPGEIDPDPAA
jgi:hypothetical protein